MAAIQILQSQLFIVYAILHFLKLFLTDFIDFTLFVKVFIEFLTNVFLYLNKFYDIYI